MDTNGWGIDLSYEDAFGNRHETPRETITALLASMDADLASLTAPKDDTVVVVRCGEQKEFASMGTVALETGETVVFEKRLPIDLPTGYHQLLLDRSERPSRLIVSPGKCWLPEHLQTWGWAVQLYAARSAESWGIGDFYDLHRLAEWSRSELGAGMMMVNPLSAATPITPQQASPYFPTSRRFFNPLWIHIEWVPNASAATVPQLQEIANAGRELNSQRRIQRDRVFELKMRALELLWLQFAGDEAFDRYCAEQGSDLDRFAVFCTLAEKHQSGWHNWPSQFQHPDNQEVARFARDNEPRIRFHKWLQWLLDAQLARCSEQLALMQDLPIGVDPDGADAWAWQDVIAKNAGV